MSKLDWSKAGHEVMPDPARVLRDHRDTTLANTPTARKEAEKKAKLKSKRAIKAAATRKANREKARLAEQNAPIFADFARQADQDFWASLKARMAAANEKRRAKPDRPKRPGALGELLQRAFSKKRAR